MHRKRNHWLMARQIAVHALIGAMLGIVFTFALFLMPGARAASAVVNSAAPIQTTLMILLVVTSNFAVGAGLTGFVFLSMDNEDNN